METVCSHEISIDFQRFIRHYIPGGGTLHTIAMRISEPILLVLIDGRDMWNEETEEFSRQYLAPFPYLDLLGQNFYLKFPYHTHCHNERILLIFSRNDWNSFSVDTILPGLFLSQFYWYSTFCYGDSHSSSNRTSSSITVSMRPLHLLHLSHILSYHRK
jgi:hypothetical protein